jgi:hypothetical protein
MYFMGLSATRFLRHWPEMKKRYSEISLHNAWIETYKHDGTLMLPPQKVSDRLHAAGLDQGNAPGAFQMRPLVYKLRSLELRSSMAAALSTTSSEMARKAVLSWKMEPSWKPSLSSPPMALGQKQTSWSVVRSGLDPVGVPCGGL